MALINKIIGAAVQGAGNTGQYMADKALEVSATRRAGQKVDPGQLTHEDPAEIQQGMLKMGGNFVGKGLGNVMSQGAGKMFGRTSDERLKEQDEETGEKRDLVAEVAEKIQNYLYHYKPGTGENPNVEYSGPMAQDLLKVDGYRSAVFQDESGLLKVDAARLAMTNAGLISDLAKRVLMLEDLIRGAFEALQYFSEEGGEEPVDIA
jgi:multimeric flavodoxin WrbA